MSRTMLIEEEEEDPEKDEILSKNNNEGEWGGIWRKLKVYSALVASLYKFLCLFSQE